MLVLSRRLNEALVIADPWTGQRIRIVVTAIQRGQVQLGIEAPAEVHIWREDVDRRLLLRKGREAAGVVD